MQESVPRLVVHPFRSSHHRPKSVYFCVSYQASAEGSSTESGWCSCGRIFRRMNRDMTPESRDAPARFSQMPLRPKGHSTPSKITGNTRAVDMEITEAGRDFSMASMLQQFDYAEDAGAETFRKDIAVLESNLEKLDEQEQKYSVELETALHEYAEAKSKTAGLDSVELYEARQSIRPGQEAAANEKLEQVFGEKYSPLRWMDAKRAQMRLTNDSVEEYAARQLAKQKCKSMLQPARRREQEHAL